jgi:hypothetical protein
MRHQKYGSFLANYLLAKKVFAVNVQVISAPAAFRSHRKPLDPVKV